MRCGEAVLLSPAAFHYLTHVLRLPEGASLRLFNGRDGEWQARLESQGKKAARAVPCEQIRFQPPAPQGLSLFFSPIKKNRMDWLIEKAVELGVTDFYPVLTQNTENRVLNVERINRQIVEAAEQCERLDVPRFHSLRALTESIQDQEKRGDVVHACIERYEESLPLGRALEENAGRATAFLIGPEGGFSREEKDFLTTCVFIRPVSLGPRILRAETAALYTLTAANLSDDRGK
ncbi:MAG: 16S rRNA (uracil(1498)-N(3))-methyltransferase [Alphaproteobacteria bacterium]|nr:16S rRNA (uracil(1498)-N(3))-methyltransferase [Alphaproteobacteria bacterium]